MLRARLALFLARSGLDCQRGRCVTAPLFDTPDLLDIGYITPVYDALTVSTLHAAVEAIFTVLCDCAAKNPDPGQSADEEDGDFFYDEDEVLAGAAAEERAARLDQYDALLDMPRAAEFEQVRPRENNDCGVCSYH